MTGLDNEGPVARQSPRRILAVHRYYWPDTPPYASLLRRIAWRWGRDGHVVHVVAGQPSYKSALENHRRPATEQLDLGVVRRLVLPNEAGRPFRRIANGLKLSLFVAWRLMVGRYDAVMISTVPPVLGGCIVSAAARLTATRFVYHCMDIHPEIGRLSGEFRNPFLFRFLRWLDSSSCRIARPAIVLSEDMRDALRERPGGDRFEIEVLNNFTLPSAAETEETPFAMQQASFTLTFAGNIGRFQGLETLVKAMGRLQRRADIELVVLGEGTERAMLEDLASRLGARVRFVGHHPVAVAKAALRKASAGYVGLMPGVYRYAYPSKTMTYLEQGLPLIVSVEPESALAREVSAQGLGRVVPPGDVDALAHAIAGMADDRAGLAGMSRKAVAFGQQAFSEERILDRWSTIMDAS